MKALKNPDTGILLFRLGIGLAFIFHGQPKLFAGPDKWESLGASMKYIGIDFLPVVWGFLAAATEFFGGVLLIFGIGFRWACAFMMFTMFIATLSHYFKGTGAFNEWSRPAELAVVFLAFIFIGPGKYVFRFK